MGGLVVVGNLHIYEFGVGGVWRVSSCDKDNLWGMSENWREGCCEYQEEVLPLMYANERNGGQCFFTLSSWRRG